MTPPVSNTVQAITSVEEMIATLDGLDTAVGDAKANVADLDALGEAFARVGDDERGNALDARVSDLLQSLQELTDSVNDVSLPDDEPGA